VRRPEAANISNLYFSSGSKQTRINYPHLNNSQLTQALGDDNYEFQTSFKMNTLTARTDMFNTSSRHQTFERQITLPNISNTDVLRRIAQLEERLFNSPERFPISDGVSKEEVGSDETTANVDSTNEVVQELLDIVQKESNGTQELNANDIDALFNSDDDGMKKRINAVIKNSKANGAYTLSSIDSWVLQKELDETTEGYHNQVSMFPNPQSQSSSTKEVFHQVYAKIPIRKRLRESWKRDERLRASQNQQQPIEDSLEEELPSREELVHAGCLETV